MTLSISYQLFVIFPKSDKTKSYYYLLFTVNLSKKIIYFYIIFTNK